VQLSNLTKFDLKLQGMMRSAQALPLSPELSRTIRGLGLEALAPETMDERPAQRCEWIASLVSPDLPVAESATQARASLDPASLPLPRIAL
jgi:hypothetical protein